MNCFRELVLTEVNLLYVYFHSLFGSCYWVDGVKQSGFNRIINHENCSLYSLQRKHANRQILRARVF